MNENLCKDLFQVLGFVLFLLVGVGGFALGRLTK
jgi:hypothetical protein